MFPLKKAICSHDAGLAIQEATRSFQKTKQNLFG